MAIEHRIVLGAFLGVLFISSGSYGGLPTSDEFIDRIAHHVVESRRAELAYSPLDPEILEDARRYRFVFVHGYLGFALNLRFVGSYMDRNREDLLHYGIPREQIFEIMPHSHHSIGENVEFVRDRLDDLAKSGDGKLVVLAHSKGAPETVAALLSDLDFVAREVEAVFAIQGAFGGSGVADYLWDEGKSLPAELVWYRKLFFRALRTAPRLARFCFGGLPSLTHERCRLFWAERRAEMESVEDLSELSKRLVYFPSIQNPDRVPFPMRSFAEYLAVSYGVSDGLVGFEDAFLSWLGNPPTDRSCGRVLAHHADLMTRMTTDAALRRGMMAAILEAIAGSRLK